MIGGIIAILWFSFAIVSLALGLFAFVLFCMCVPEVVIDIFTCHGRDSSEH